VVEAVPSAASGASLTGAMVMLTAATLLSANPSFATNVNVSDPLTLGLGVYVKAPVAGFVSAATPLVALVTIL
jgi:hypothetical protein